VSAFLAQARIPLLRGNLAESLRLKEEFLPRAREIDDPQILGPALVISAQIEQAAGHASAALDLVEEFFQVTKDDPGDRSAFLPDAVRVSAAAHDIQWAERILADERESDVAGHQCSLLAARAIVAEATGAIDPASSLYVDAFERWAAYGNVPERGYALLGSGRCLVSLGRPADARAPLRQARDIFVGLKAKSLTEEIDSWLEHVTALTS
jgi:tetratricopeptide (TPR) repeat protein